MRHVSCVTCRMTRTVLFIRVCRALGVLGPALRHFIRICGRSAVTSQKYCLAVVLYDPLAVSSKYNSLYRKIYMLSFI